MKENVKLRLYGLAFLGVMITFLCVHLSATDVYVKTVSAVTSGIWLIAFLISQYRVYKMETKETNIDVCEQEG